MLEILQTAAGLGVGAFLGTLIFIMYRKDRLSTEKMWRESKKFTEDRLTKLLEDSQANLKENTKATTELTTLVKRLNGR